MSRSVLIPLILSLLGTPASLFAQTPAARPLTIVSSGPSGEVAALAEANEIRIVFSEPMVTLGRIPSAVPASFVRITPAVAGSFRWSGTTILIFTPDPKKPLPYATTLRGDRRHDRRRCQRARSSPTPHHFAFTTPTVKLLQTDWYRRGGRAGAQMVVALRFNQRVRAADVLAHLTARFEQHDWAAPMLPAATEARLRQIDPQAPAAFEAKIAATRTVASATAPVPVRLTNDWDKKQFPPAPTLVVFETTGEVPPESWVRLQLDDAGAVAGGTGDAGGGAALHDSGREGFFRRRLQVRSAVRSGPSQPVRMRAEVKVTDFAKAVRALDLSATPPRAVTKPATPPERPDYEPDARRRVDARGCRLRRAAAVDAPTP